MAKVDGSNGVPLGRANLASHYDNIIIGGGIGGLTCAAALALMGQKVLVLESHYSLGGYTHTFRKGGYQFNTGLHYDGQVGYHGHPLNSIFDWISDGRLKWNLFPGVSNRILIGDNQDEYIIPAGVNAFKEALCGKFPAESKAIVEYIKMIQKAEHTAALFFAEKMVPKSLGDVLGPLLRAPFLKYSRKTTYDVLRTLTSDEKLISVLTGTWYEIGIPPKVSSFAGHAAARGNVIGGTFFPSGGTNGLARQIIPTIERCGGQVVFSAKVDKVNIRDGVAYGVELEGGTKISAKSVISSIGTKGTFSRLIDADNLSRFPFLETLQKMTPTCSSAGVFVGLKGSPAELNLPNYPLVSLRSYDYQAALAEFHNSPKRYTKSPYLYMISLAARDPDWTQHNPGKSTMLVELYDSIDGFQKWAGSKTQERSDAYTDYKEEMKDYLLDKLYAMYPQLRGKVEVAEAYTPLTVKHFASHPSGEIYGLAQDPLRFDQTWLRPDTPIKNLYLTGVDICISSIIGAALGGAFTAINILGPVRGRELLMKMLPWKFSRRDESYYK